MKKSKRNTLLYYREYFVYFSLKFFPPFQCFHFLLNGVQKKRVKNKKDIPCNIRHGKKNCLMLVSLCSTLRGTYRGSFGKDVVDSFLFRIYACIHCWLIHANERETSFWGFFYLLILLTQAYFYLLNQCINK